MRSTANTVEVVAAGDNALMADVSVGNVEAFDHLYARFSARAYRVALSVCRDHARAEEAMQEGFLSIWKSSAHYHPQRGTVAAWILTVVRHRAIDLVRRDGGVTAVWPTDECILNNRAAGEDVYQQVAALGQRDDMRAWLNQLPEAQHEVITLAFYGQLSHTEIAKQLDVPTGTVKGRMRLGMEKLRTIMEGGHTG